ncbi:MAG: hypothetical protein PHP01_01105 [Phycisphaerae bacterium]|nr:hypothetical protein [Phycisphaerae bacterium]
MAILSIKDINFIKLKSLKKEHLKDFCEHFSISIPPNILEMIKNILLAYDNNLLSTEQINAYIKNLYSDIRKKEIAETGATHQAIINELNKVDAHIWGMVQGKADGYIQRHYVRKYFKFDELLIALNDGSLLKAMEAYTLCSWYNHWSTVFLEDLICLNKNVVPIIKKVKGVDVIWNEQAVDIKATNLPKEWFRDKYTIDDAINDPVRACEYLYTYQGAERFGSENRFFVILYDRTNPSDSWKIKRDYSLIKESVDKFFSQDLELDTINFSFGKNKTPHMAHAKMMFIVK